MNISIISPRRTALPVFGAQLKRDQMSVGRDADDRRPPRPTLDPRLAVAYRIYLSQLASDITGLGSSGPLAI